MNALARLATPDLDAIGAIIAVLENGARASRELDAQIFEAMGWQVTRAHAADRHAPWTIRSTWSRQDQPLPRVTKRIDSARVLVPWGWDWGTGERTDAAYGWCSNRHAPLLPGNVINPQSQWFEAKAATPALALVKCCLYGQRAALLTAPSAVAAIAGHLTCHCGWEGPESALRARSGGAARFCPDCDRAVTRMDP